MFRLTSSGAALGALMLSQLAPSAAQASSHMDAPLISLDPAANTADVYAFKSNEGGISYLTTALTVFPFEEPGIGPNNYHFDPSVNYDINVSVGSDIAKGKADITYRFQFSTGYANTDTILQTYLGVVDAGSTFSSNQNLRQVYKVTKIDHRRGDVRTVLGNNLPVPPNNQGRVTPYYNQGDSGDNPAKEGVASTASLDPYTRNAVERLNNGYVAFAGQRDDGFFGDIQSIFDLDFSFDKPAPFDSQGGFNVHAIVHDIPLSELGGATSAGVYVTTSRTTRGRDVQVGRQGNPLFNEALVGEKLKDYYNRSSPKVDYGRFLTYAANPQLSQLLGVTPLVPGLLEQIYIPDLIKVDLTTPPARLAGQPGFNRLSVFGNDTLQSTATGGAVAGGWPNGRRFGDDVIDIAVIALGAAGSGPNFSTVNVDKVTANDITYNMVFPFAATPQNGRNHIHHE